MKKRYCYFFFLTKTKYILTEQWKMEVEVFDFGRGRSVSLHRRSKLLQSILAHAEMKRFEKRYFWGKCLF